MSKNILMFANVNNFNPKAPSMNFLCRKCKTVGQMTLIYKELLPVIFHFEKGIGNTLVENFFVI